MLVRPSSSARTQPGARMQSRFALFAAAVIVLTTACHEPFGLKAEHRVTASLVAGSSSAITVMTQNLYVGADVDLVIRALGTPDPGDDFPALQLAIETVGKTDFPARAQVIADEIARRRPK